MRGARILVGLAPSYRTLNPDRVAPHELGRFHWSSFSNDAARGGRVPQSCLSAALRCLSAASILSQTALSYRGGGRWRFREEEQNSFPLSQRAAPSGLGPPSSSLAVP